MENEGKNKDIFSEDDDFEFGKKDSNAGDDTKGDDTKGDDAVDDDNADDDTKGDDTKGDDTKDDDAAGDDSSDDKNKDGKDNGGKKKEVKGKDNKGTPSKDKDIFADDDEQEDGKKVKTNFKRLASGLDIDLEKEDDEEEFITKTRSKIEGARQEFKLDDYPEEAKKVINHLTKNNGKIEDFFQNKVIVSLQSVIAMDPKEKLFATRINELRGAGLAADKAKEQATTELEELSTREIKDKAADIDNQAHEIIREEIKKITGDRTAQEEIKKAKVLDKAKGEINALKTFVSSQKEFMGIPLTDKAIKVIIRDIETGAFDEISNKTPENSKFTAYMMAKYGKQIDDELKKASKEANRQGYNAAHDKSKDALHKTGSADQHKASGKQQSGDSKGRFDGFANIED